MLYWPSHRSCSIRGARPSPTGVAPLSIAPAPVFICSLCAPLAAESLTLLGNDAACMQKGAHAASEGWGMRAGGGSDVTPMRSVAAICIPLIAALAARGSLTSNLQVMGDRRSKVGIAGHTYEADAVELRTPAPGRGLCETR